MQINWKSWQLIFQTTIICAIRINYAHDKLNEYQWQNWNITNDFINIITCNLGANKCFVIRNCEAMRLAQEMPACWRGATWYVEWAMAVHM